MFTMSPEKSAVFSPILCPSLRIYNIYHHHDKISQFVICCGPVFILLTKIRGITLHYLRISCFFYSTESWFYTVLAATGILGTTILLIRCYKKCDKNAKRKNGMYSLTLLSLCANTFLNRTHKACIHFNRSLVLHACQYYCCYLILYL